MKSAKKILAIAALFCGLASGNNAQAQPLSLFDALRDSFSGADVAAPSVSREPSSRSGRGSSAAAPASPSAAPAFRTVNDAALFSGPKTLAGAKMQAVSTAPAYRGVNDAGLFGGPKTLAGMSLGADARQPSVPTKGDVHGASFGKTGGYGATGDRGGHSGSPGGHGGGPGGHGGGHGGGHRAEFYAFRYV